MHGRICGFDVVVIITYIIVIPVFMSVYVREGKRERVTDDAVRLTLHFSCQGESHRQV